MLLYTNDANTTHLPDSLLEILLSSVLPSIQLRLHVDALTFPELNEPCQPDRQLFRLTCSTTTLRPSPRLAATSTLISHHAIPQNIASNSNGHTQPCTMSATELPLTRESIVAAHTLIKPHIHTTPVLTNTTLSNLASTPQSPEALKGTPWEGQDPAKPNIRLFFKAENFQKIGAFKVRGAFHAVLRLVEERGIEDVRKKGVVTHSSG